MHEFADLVRAVPDFPQKGILFRDITPLLAEPGALGRVVEAIAERFAGERIDKVAAIESRGFIFGAPLATELGCGFVPIRKLGKLPRQTISREYALEYGVSHLEMHVDALESGERVLLVDDVLATGGTARAAGELIRQAGGELAGAAFVIELSFLRGREQLEVTKLLSLLSY